jgi:hypothetical protein
MVGQLFFLRPLLNSPVIASRCNAGSRAPFLGAWRSQAPKQTNLIEKLSPFGRGLPQAGEHRPTNNIISWADARANKNLDFVQPIVDYYII